jgi:hypothetical protein
MTIRAALALSLMLLSGCSAQQDSNASAGPALVEGDLPPGNTAIARVAVGDRCSRPQYCGGIGYLDCGAAADGGAVYFDREDGEIISVCGGACMADIDRCHRECPPPAWRAAGCQSTRPPH